VPKHNVAKVDDHDLIISRVINAPRAAVWKAWTEPELLKEWWCPKPWTTEVRAFDLRAGGSFHTFMKGPDGGESDNPGCFLEVIRETRLVFTSCLIGGWRPATPWMSFTAIISMADEGENTRYIATVMHPDQATRDRHEELGFFDGWGTCTDQLAALAVKLGQGSVK
jgi:uncharacterized protein YndB with AHSA1/START domain